MQKHRKTECTLNIQQNWGTTDLLYWATKT